jgi:hypothetical protein
VAGKSSSGAGSEEKRGARNEGEHEDEKVRILVKVGGYGVIKHNRESQWGIRETSLPDA